MKRGLRNGLILCAGIILLYANWLVFAPLLQRLPHAASPAPVVASAARQEQGQQIIHIVAQHGYTPPHSIAKAGVPTVLEFELAGYDCSAALNIPALHVQQMLKRDALTRIDVPPQATGTTLQGMCSMGMYRFDIRFE